MKIDRYFKSAIYVCLFFISTCCFSAAPEWKIIPAESHLTFTAMQNNAPAKGEFKKFTGDIHFDPNQLNASDVRIVVDMGSVSDSYNKMTDTLKSLDWFNVASFPQAIFKSTQFNKTGDKNYESKGTLTLRDKTLPVTLVLILEEYTDKHARMTGSAVIKRTAFGVGQGEWADTGVIKDDVEVKFVINAEKK